MKKAIIYLIILLLNSFTGYSQDIITNPETQANMAIQQISILGINDILSFQTLNQGFGNYANTRQAGNHNSVTVNQKADVGYGFSNQSYSIQDGNSNEMTVGQIGSGNLLLSYQIGYLTTLPNISSFSSGLESSLVSTVTSNESNAMLSIGERNKLQVIQEGTHNGIIAIQQGSNNVIEVGQKASNNYLAILQRGMNNSISGYVQENTSATNLFETVTQIGENNSLIATDVSRAKAMGNVINQSGVNLSLEVNNGLINTMGGIEINQTGHDMKVVVDQSYFSFPLQ